MSSNIFTELGFTEVEATQLQTDAELHRLRLRLESLENTVALLLEKFGDGDIARGILAFERERGTL